MVDTHSGLSLALRPLEPIHGLAGASGATLFLDMNTGTIIKQDPRKPELMREQAEFMRFHGQGIFPRIFEVGDDWYEMEALHHLEETYEGIYEDMRRLLTRVWRTRSFVRAADVLTDDHEQYISDRAGMYRDAMLKWLRRIQSYSLLAVEYTHGDCTIENLMRKSTGKLCFIDPLPASPKMPALQSVDIGKMLQSCWGYEEAKGTAKSIGWDRRDLVDHILDKSTEQERDASLYFMCVHYLRLIPYQHKTLQPFFLGMFASALSLYGQVL